ncbi:MAG: transketolase [Treponema sp.]|nr:MAG: transketolase [Treponema sp.]
MAIDIEKRKFLEKKARELRHLTVETTFHAGSGHLGGALSMMDIGCLLYYHVMNIDKNNPDFEDRDRFIMSKGHAGIGYVSILADIGFIEHEDLKTFNLTGSKLGMHLDANKVKGVDASTGSLGHGLSMALGIALSAKLLKKDYYTYCLLGDGECNEGSVWEAAMAIGHYNANNLITMVDRNHAMIDGETEDVMKLEPFADKWTAFGFHTVVVNGHDINAMNDAIEDAKKREDKPTCIILDTVKGQGVDFAAGDYKWHYGAINEERRDLAHKSIDVYHDKRDQEVL